MMSGTTPDRGDLVLIPFPFTDLTATKRRPVLVLSHRSYNRRSQDFIVCGVTSVLAPRPYAVRLRPRDLVRGRIPVESLIRPDKLFTLRQSLATKSLGRVSPTVLAQVLRELASILRLRAP